MPGRPWTEMMQASGLSGIRVNAARSQLLEEGFIEEAARPINPVTRKPEKGTTYVIRNVDSPPNVP
jgi:hypothetical protein